MEYRLNSPDVVQEELDGEVIVVHLISGSYYSLTRGGSLETAARRPISRRHRGPSR